MTTSQGGPLDTTGRCILSLDGGVRGLSTLYILRTLMGKVNDERAKKKKPAVKPCELFDLIGGTSTGGIIAIMLGRLEMDVDECIDAYRAMFERIFGGKKAWPVDWKGNIKAKLDSKILKECIKDILAKHHLKETELFNDESLVDGTKRNCKVAVCISNERHHNLPATISEAVRATSAASTFFDPVEIGPDGMKFVDGGLGANNPVNQLWIEADRLWGEGDFRLGSLLKCYVSIGTGNPGIKPIAKDALRFVSETLRDIATETQHTADDFAKQHTTIFKSRYFRFNVEQGLQDIGLEEFKKTPNIVAATNNYLDQQGTKMEFENCASNLEKKDSKSSSGFSVKRILEWQRQQKVPCEKPLSMLPFERNRSLVFRKAVFEQLDRIVAENYRSVAVWGLGGSGKTQVALEYAYRRLEVDSFSVFWVQGDSEANFIKSYGNIAKLAGLPPNLKGEKLLLEVRNWVFNCSSWVLIIDNADDLSIYKTLSSRNNDTLDSDGGPQLLQFVPKVGSNGTVIWTSRDSSICGNIVQVKSGIRVGEMTIEESLELFHNLSGEPDELHEQIRNLSDLLEKLPLAIAQAAAYIRETGVSIKAYLQKLKGMNDETTALLSEEFNDTHQNVPKSVMSTWRISMNQISKEHPCGMRILSTLAFLDNRGLPFELLSTIAGNEFTEAQIRRIATRLAQFSFFQIHKASGTNNPSYEQHRLAQLAAQHSLNEDQKKNFARAALRAIASLFPVSNFETWSLCKVYLPHSLKVCQWIQAENYDTSLGMLLHNIATYYLDQGQVSNTETLIIQKLQLSKTCLGDRHPDTLTAMSNLAYTWSQQGHLDKAELLEVKLPELHKSILGDQHPDTLAAMSNLAYTWSQQGHLDKAELLQVEVLELCKSTLGDQHPDTLAAMSYLAHTWREQGQLDKAEPLQVEVLELCKSVLGEQHPDTILTMKNLKRTQDTLAKRKGAQAEKFAESVSTSETNTSVSDAEPSSQPHRNAPVSWNFKLKEKFKRSDR